MEVVLVIVDVVTDVGNTDVVVIVDGIILELSEVIVLDVIV